MLPVGVQSDHFLSFSYIEKNPCLLRMVLVENNHDERRVLFVISWRETEPHFIDHNFYRG